MPQPSPLDLLPDELLMQVFTHLTELGSCYDGMEDPWFLKRIPFRHMDSDDVPHPRLRAYPFLGQVCTKWKNLLEAKHSQEQLWKQLVIDFGHELVTAIHTPLEWSNQRPSQEEFAMALGRTTLSVAKIIKFVEQHKGIVTSLALCNSEGFWGDDGEYLSLQSKHDFKPSHLGYVLCLLREQLQELQLFNCNDLIKDDPGLWSLAPLCPQLRVLVVEGLNCRVPSAVLGELAQLKKLEQLSLVGEEVGGNWIVGIDAIPASWSALTSLQTLELRGHQMLVELPSWLPSLSSLRKLDISCNSALNLGTVSHMTQLEVLAMQQLDLSQVPASTDEPISTHAKRVMPDLTPLAPKLRALSLSRNRFTRVPDCVTKLTGLEILDLSGNRELAVPTPLTTMLNAMPRISILDFRGIHVEKQGYWSDAKCNTMKHLAAMAKTLKRRKYAQRVLLDT